MEKVSVEEKGRQCGRVKRRKIKGKGKEETNRTERTMKKGTEKRINDIDKYRGRE